MNLDIDKFREITFNYINSKVVANNPKRASEITDYILATLALTMKKDNK